MQVIQAMRKSGLVPRARFLFPRGEMILQRLGQVWLYHGSESHRTRRGPRARPDPTL